MTVRALPPLPAAPRPPKAVTTRTGFASPLGAVLPRGALARPQAKARPLALPLPSRGNLQAYVAPTNRADFDRISAKAAGVRALAAGDNVIGMFETIGEDWWTGGGVTAKKVAAQLRAIGDRPVEVQINSNGGDMFEGIAIYNVLREHPQPITIKVMGMAASAASVIAMAGDVVEIGAASFLMIHNCWVMAAGNRHELRDVADYLEPFDQAMVDLYAQRSGQPAATVAKWLDAETYMSGSQAIANGLADTLLPADATKVDAKAMAGDQDVNAVRTMELALLASGYTRTQARAHINKIKGTPGAALNDGTPGAADTAWLGAAASLLKTLKS